MRPVKHLSPFLILFLFFFPLANLSGPSVGTVSLDPVIQEFLQLVNSKRHSVGCQELAWDHQVAQIALKHSKDMVSRNFFGHTNPEGKDLFSRLRESNIFFSMVAENIAFGMKDGRQAYQTWLTSPEHRKNMLDCRFTRHGVAHIKGRWTHILLKPK